jgi:tubulin beta
LEWQNHFVLPFEVHARAPPAFLVSRAKFWEVVCDEHGNGGGGKYCGGGEYRNNVLYHEASGCKYITRALLFDLEPGVIGAVRASPLGELFRPDNFVTQNAGADNNSAKALYIKAASEFC